jgi:hypothetical protein
MSIESLLQLPSTLFGKNFDEQQNTAVNPLSLREKEPLGTLA